MQELTRDEFTEMLVRELKLQGLESVPPRLGQGPSSLPLVSTKSWTASKTYQELQMHQARAPQIGLDNLANALRDPSTNEYVLTPQFLTSVCSLVHSQQPGAANLASAVFITVVGRTGDVELAQLIPPGLRLPYSQIPELCQVIPMLEHRPNVWRTYLEVLRECLQAGMDTSSQQEFNGMVSEMLHCCLPQRGKDAPTELEYMFVECVAGLCKQTLVNAGAGRPPKHDLKEQFMRELAPTVTRLLLVPSATGNQVATCLGLFQLFDLFHDDNVVQFAAQAWVERRFERSGDLFLENFLLVGLWKHGVDFTAAVKAKAMESSSYTKLLWPLLFALQAGGEEEFAVTVPVDRPNVLFTYLAKNPDLLARLKTWRHVEKQWKNRSS
ncbi:hypothetical protein BASA81_004496 [Batrachochytrium salamandrivorans]|nr:hypothetical protein BASA81_004496 [Batrachochytrium salamandrivorans]